MSLAQEAIGGALVNVGLSFLAGYGLFKLIYGQGKANTPVDYGRKWSAWAVLLATIVALPTLFRLWNIESLATWLLSVIVFGGLAYLLGWNIERYKQSKLLPKVIKRELGSRRESIQGDLEQGEGKNGILKDDEIYELVLKEIKLNKLDKRIYDKLNINIYDDREKMLTLYVSERVKKLKKLQKEKLVNRKNKYIEENIRELMELREQGWDCKEIALEKLSSIGISDINHVDKDGLTPLMHSAIDGDKNKAMLLLLAGANIYKKTKSGETAVRIAKNNEHYDVALLISEEGKERHMLSLFIR